MRLVSRTGSGAWALLAVVAMASPAQAMEPVGKASQFIPIADEAPPRLSLDQPLAGPLAARGTAVIPYRLQNFRILPIFGPSAAGVSPRAGHLHVTVDDLPWHWADAGNVDSVVVAGLSPGRHSVLIELATPEHSVISGQRVHFTVPGTGETHRTHRRGPASKASR